MLQTTNASWYNCWKWEMLHNTEVMTHMILQNASVTDQRHGDTQEGWPSGNRAEHEPKYKCYRVDMTGYNQYTTVANGDKCLMILTWEKCQTNRCKPDDNQTHPGTPLRQCSVIKCLTDVQVTLQWHECQDEHWCLWKGTSEKKLGIHISLSMYLKVILKLTKILFASLTILLKWFSPMSHSQHTSCNLFLLIQYPESGLFISFPIFMTLHFPRLNTISHLCLTTAVFCLSQQYFSLCYFKFLS